MPEVSVIIPVYNAEHYILDLLGDLREQTYKRVEFILVNDGSTDNSLQIINEYIDNSFDHRFKVINQSNKGVSCARNNGLRHALGNYIIFVDSDDRLSKFFVEKYVNRIISHSTDIEVFSAIKIKDRRRLTCIGKLDYSPIASDANLNVNQYIKYFSNLQAWGYPFCYIFKRTLWDNVQFNSEIKYQEDVLAFFEIWTKHPELKIHVNADAYYYYVLRENSALHTMSSPDAWQFVEVDNKILGFVKEQPSLRDSYSYLLALKASSLMIVIATSCLEDNNYYYRMARSEFISLTGKAKYLSKKVYFRRKLQLLVVFFNLRPLIKKLYTHLYSD